MNVQPAAPPPCDSIGGDAQPVAQPTGLANSLANAPDQQPGDRVLASNNSQADSREFGDMGAVDVTELLDQDDDTCHIPGINPNVDMDFYNCLHCVEPQLSEEERAYTDEFLESLTTEPLRLLAGKMAYDFWEGKARKRKSHRDGVPTSGKKGPLVSKILAYYMYMREENLTDQTRQINHGPTFDHAEDARLIEIMTDPDIFADIRFAFQSGSRADIDSVDGSLVETTWNAIIAGRYFNNFDGFQPPDRHTDPNDVLYQFQPNKSNICRRTGTALKSRFSQLRSKCTVLNQAWGRSGDNDPSLFEGFCMLNQPLDRSAYFMWLRIREGGQLVASRLLRLVPLGNDSRTTTRDNAELMRIMQGRESTGKDKVDAGGKEVERPANNSNNGGAIGQVAKITENKKKRKKDVDDPTLAMLAGTLEAIADPKGRRASRRAQLISTLDGLDSKMNSLIEELDPHGDALLKSGIYISRRRKLYREARKRRWLCQRELEALEAGHDDVDKLPREDEPATDDEEAELLHDGMDD